MSKENYNAGKLWNFIFFFFFKLNCSVHFGYSLISHVSKKNLPSCAYPNHIKIVPTLFSTFQFHWVIVICFQKVLGYLNIVPTQWEVMFAWLWNTWCAITIAAQCYSLTCDNIFFSWHKVEHHREKKYIIFKHQIFHTEVLQVVL